MAEPSSITPEFHAPPATWITIVCSVSTVAVVALAYHGLERTRGRHWKTQLLYWTASIAVIVGLPYTTLDLYLFTGLTATLIGTVFPIYESEEDDDKAWLQYWMVGGILFVYLQWVKTDDTSTYWYSSLTFFFVWLFFPQTDGAALLYDTITEPFIAPRVRPLAAKMNNVIQYIYQTLVNAVHLWIVWLIFMFLPAGLKRIIAILIGTVYPWVSSVTAAATEEVEDDTYWLTYWSCYGVLFLLMEILETYLGWIPGFYTVIIFTTVWLMLPMMGGADKVFRKILVPLAGLKEMLLLRDAISVKKTMLRDLDPERARAVRKAIAKFYDDDDDSADPGALKTEMMNGWKGIQLPRSLPKIRNPFAKSDSAPGETTPLNV